MSLSSLHLDAFHEVAKARSFSLAAKALHITQSALSQRVLNLEEALGSSLFIRESSGVRLTDLGTRLLLYCQNRAAMEEEFLSRLGKEGQGELAGSLRVGCFSTVGQSVVLPIVAELVRQHPSLHTDIRVAEMRDLPGMLAAGAVDFIFSTCALEKQGVECELLGYEQNVQVRALGRKYREDVFLDHDAEDTVTQDFFKLQGKRPPKYRRDFLDDVHGIVEGVRLGLGQAVLPLHIIRSLKGVEIVETAKVMRVPIYFCYHSTSYQTRLRKTFIGLIQERFSEFLDKNA